MEKAILPYGKDYITLDFPEKNELTFLEPPSSGSIISDIKQTVEDLLESPDTGDALRKIIQKKKQKVQGPSAVVIVNDLSRSTPVKELLPPVLETLHKEGISKDKVTILIATGTHRVLTDEENVYLLGKEITERYRIESHDCDSDDLISAGTLSTGNELLINGTVARADLRIAIGEVLFHYFAGVAGGRKSLCPGVCGRSTIMRNHQMMTHPAARLGNIDNNPLNNELMEALDLCPLDFIVNALCNHRKEVATIVAGDPVASWEKGVKIFKELNTVTVSRPSKVVIASAGGFPKDINLYQTQKAFEMAGQAVKDGGSLVIFAECPEEYGNKTFESWAKEEMTSDEVIDRFESGFQLGAHKLYYLARMSRRINLFLYSSLNEETSKKVFCTKIRSWEDCLKNLQSLHGDDFDALLISQGGILLPQISGNNR